MRECLHFSGAGRQKTVIKLVLGCVVMDGKYAGYHDSGKW